MKKIINLKEVMIILISVVVIAISSSVFASDPDGILGDGVNPIQASEYEKAQTVPKDDSTPKDTDDSTPKDTKETKLPQTGIEDYNIGILLIIFVASAIFAYKKIDDYKNI